MSGADRDAAEEVARSAFEDADRNLFDDLADAGTSAQARAVQENRDAALARYVRMLRASFGADVAVWGTLLRDAQAAAGRLREARAGQEALAARLAAMSAVAAAVGGLAEAVA